MFSPIPVCVCVTICVCMERYPGVCTHVCGSQRQTSSFYSSCSAQGVVLYCVVLYCVVLFCVVLCCVVLYCVALFCEIGSLTGLWLASRLGRLASEPLESVCLHLHQHWDYKRPSP